VTRKYLFADEAGDFAFKRAAASRYFIACCVTLEDCHIGTHLLQLRREVAWRKIELGDYFHASGDR
jgi:hypothetical protein